MRGWWGPVTLSWIFHSASSLEQQSAGRHIASIGNIILISSQRSHVKVVHQLKSINKTCFYFLVQYTRKCINSTHLSNKPIQLCVIYSKWKKIYIRNQSHRSRDHIKEKVASRYDNVNLSPLLLPARVTNRSHSTYGSSARGDSHRADFCPNSVVSGWKN